MNEVIDTMLSHRSIRKFKEEPVSEAQLASILHAAQHASSSSNMQAYSVIGVTDQNIRKQLAELAGNQAYVEKSPVFLVWCGDLCRLEQAASRHYNEEMLSTTENFIISTVDAALAAQNAAIAAESLGLGIVYIGGIRNHPKEVSELLALPKHVYPIFGMCIGVPDQEPLVRPRLPLADVYHENKYTTDNREDNIDEYDKMMSNYMLDRSNGKANTTWSQAMATKVVPQRMHMREFLNSQGFKLE